MQHSDSTGATTKSVRATPMRKAKKPKGHLPKGYAEVEEIKDWRFNTEKKDHEFKVKWKGVGDSEN